MKQSELMAAAWFISTITPIMQANPVGGLLTAGIAIALAYIYNQHGK